MDHVETEKLAWIKDLPPPSTGDAKVSRFISLTTAANTLTSRVLYPEPGCGRGQTINRVYIAIFGCMMSQLLARCGNEGKAWLIGQPQLG